MGRPAKPPDPQRPLNQQEENFIEAVLSDPSMNARRAALAAGYPKLGSKSSEYSRASKLMNDPPIRRRIEEGIRKRRDALQIHQERVLLELEAMAFASIDHYDFDSGTGEITVKEDAPEHAKRALAKLRVKPILNPRNGELSMYELDTSLWNKNDAIKQLREHLGMPGTKFQIGFDPKNPLKTENEVVVYLPDNGRGDRT